MSNRKLNPATGKKEYIPRAQRKAARAERRMKAGAPPERKVGPNGKSYLGKVETYDPQTGDVIEPAHDAPIDPGGNGALFLIEGVEYVYKELGGHRGFLAWAREHPTKFRELSMKLIPAQVTIQQNNLTGTVTVVHALAPPGYNPSNPPLEVEKPPELPAAPEQQPTVSVHAERRRKLRR